MCARADGFVAGVLNVTANVAHGSFCDTRHLVKIVLRSPKTSGGKNGGLCLLARSKNLLNHGGERLPKKPRRTKRLHQL